MKLFEITDSPDQQFGMILNRRRVTMRLRYNPTSDRWAFDLAIDDLPVIHGRKITVGVDLLEPFRLGLGSIFAIETAAGGVPDRQGLPSGLVRLYHATDEEMNAAIS